jgi:hypothetical protein
MNWEPLAFEDVPLTLTNKSTISAVLQESSAAVDHASMG